MCIFHNGDAVQTTTVPSSEFCKVWGLNDIKIGDIIGERTDYIKDTHFAEPQMEATINAVPKERIHDLYAHLWNYVKKIRSLKCGKMIFIMNFIFAFSVKYKRGYRNNTL